MSADLTKTCDVAECTNVGVHDVDNYPVPGIRVKLCCDHAQRGAIGGERLAAANERIATALEELSKLLHKEMEYQETQRQKFSSPSPTQVTHQVIQAAAQIAGGVPSGVSGFVPPRMSVATCPVCFAPMQPKARMCSVCGASAPTGAPGVFMGAPPL